MRGVKMRAVAAENAVDEAGAENLRQEFVEDDPLVVPRDDPASLVERAVSATAIEIVVVTLAAGHALVVDRRAEVPIFPQHVDDVVVEQQHRDLDPRDHHVLVVPRVRDDGRAVGHPRQVLEEAPAFDDELAPVTRLIQLRADRRAAAIHGVEIEHRRARVGRAFGHRRHAKPRRRVERHVMVEKLAEEGRAGGVRRVVGVSGTQQRFRDETDRPDLEWIRGVHDSAGGSQLDQRPRHG